LEILVENFAVSKYFRFSCYIEQEMLVENFAYLPRYGDLNN